MIATLAISGYRSIRDLQLPLGRLNLVTGANGRGKSSPVLGNDGTDLPSAFATIREVGDSEALKRTIDDAFPGSRIEIEVQAGRFEVPLRQHGLLRPLAVAELSDGTL